MKVILLLLALATHARAATVAYWRFEAGPANTPVPHSGAAGAFDGRMLDDSGNGNHLSAWTQGDFAGFQYRSEVPFATVPQNGAPNLFSIKNTGANPAAFTSPTGAARSITPAQFTIEASYRPEANGGYRTIVGRDARNVSTGNADLAALYLQVRPDDSVGITFTDVSGYTHSAYSPPGWLYGFDWGTNPNGTGAPWYHIAAVSDGATLRVYVDNLLVATTTLIGSGSPNRALAAGSTVGAGYTSGAWTVGRGLYAGNHTDRAYGFIDEVRISDSALPPGQLLTASRPRVQVTGPVDGLATVNVTGGQRGATARVIKSSDLSRPMSQWIEVGTRTFDANGAFTMTIGSSGQDFFAVRYNLNAAPVGALRYQLAGGHENWPADIKARIVYAMDGAVALYNRYGTFNKLLTVNYNAGVPTAQANYDGWIDFGGQIGYRTALHEIGHTMGIGTAPNYWSFLSNGIWTGAQGIAQIRAFDGPAANINSDGTHIWPYGLNYDNEGSTFNNRKHVLIVAAMRRDMGIQ